MAWECLTGRMGEPGTLGSPKVEAGEAGQIGAAKRGTGAMEMVREVRGRSLPPED